MALSEDTVHLIAGQTRLEDEYKDPDVLPKVKNAANVMYANIVS